MNHRTVTALLIVVCILVITGIGITRARNKSSIQPESVSSNTQPAGAVENTSSPNGETVLRTKVTVPITTKIPILTYHTIAPKPPHKESQLQLHYRVTPEIFEQQMKYLADQNYQPITFDHLVRHVTYGDPVPEKSVVITFDDGWKNQYQYAVPLLKKYGFTATFFIVFDYRTSGYMTWEELSDLVDSGFEIASHTKSHQKLSALTSQELLDQELLVSKTTLEEKLGITVTTIAYPYYSHNEHVRDAVAQAGYLGARAGWGSFTNSTDHVFEMVSQEVVNNAHPFASTRSAE